MSETDGLNDRARLSEAKRLLLQKRLAEKLKRAVPGQTIPVRSKKGPVPLIQSQHLLWFTYQLDPNNPAYNVRIAFHFGGTLDIAALEAAINEIIRRHEALRITIATVDDELVQVTSPELKLMLPIVELSEISESERKAYTSRLIIEDARRGFDLIAGPLVRAMLLRVNEQEHVFLLTMHHIISDGWSRTVLMQELAALYKAYSAGEPSPLTDLTIQYTDFAAWLNEKLSGPALEARLLDWKRQLEGVEVLELATDHPRLPKQTYRGSYEVFQISPSVTDKLKALAQQQGATLFMVLLAAYKVLLYRYSGQANIAVGTPIAGRNWAESEALIGLFVNTVALKADLGGNPSFLEVLARVKDVCLHAYANQEMPFDRLVRELGLDRDLSRTPLYQVMFILQNVPRQSLRVAGLSMTPVAERSMAAKLEQTLVFNEAGSRLWGELQYNADLYEAATIKRMSGHLANLIEAISEEPGEEIGQLRLMSERERQQVLVEWNQTHREYDRGQTLHSRFEAQAARAPQGVAVVCGKHEVTYAELNQRANQLAHRLIRMGIGRERLVGVCMERGIEMVAGLLAILKAGGAYVPIDPTYPRERIQYMIEDAKLSVLLTQSALLTGLPEDVEKICLDSETEQEQTAGQSEQNPRASASGDSLAYVIYTSGSTGKPKGVMVEHRSVADFIKNIALDYEMRPDDRVLQFASVGFDISVEEIFLAMSSGAALVLRTDAMLGSTSQFFEACDRYGITVLDLPTAYWHELAADIEAAGKHIGGDVRLVIIGGERALAERVSAWQKAVGQDRRLINSYGPTESTVVATLYEAPGPDQLSQMPHEVPIGRPITNVQTYVLDHALRPVPINVPGQLYIGGLRLGRGYLNSPELTADRFIPDPFSQAPGARLYRTGDRVRFRANGTIEFLGRFDNQVKVRGFRIELGEIEAALVQHRFVREAVAVARASRAGNKTLVAYIVSGEDRVSGSQLRAYLKTKLPDYMMPSAYVMLDELPLTVNGKVDYHALPEPQQQPMTADGDERGRRPVEEIVAGIWEQVLEINHAGLQENFFALGGHSLLATQVLSRIRDAFNVEIGLNKLFEQPTVEGLSQIIEQRIKAGHLSTSAPIKRAARQEAMPVSFAQHRLWFLDQLDPGSSFYNVPVAVKITGALKPAILQASLSEVARRHEILRTRFELTGAHPVQVIEPPAPISISVIDLGHLPEPERQAEALRLAAREAERPFDLSRAPLFRAMLLRLGGSEQILLLTMHHIISDGWSLRVLIEEMAALYEAFASSRRSPLPELELQYADYAVWQTERLQAAAIAGHLAYWKQHLDGLQALEMPTDRPRPDAQSHQGAARTLNIDARTAARLKDLSRGEGATLYMVLLAAFKVLLYRYSGQTDIAVGTPVAGRDRAELENLIGFFVNTLVIRVELRGDPSFRELVRRVKEVCLAAYAHQEVPFDKLVEELQPERHLSRNPLFQVMFVHQNETPLKIEFKGLALSSVSLDTGAAKFDLLLASRSNLEGLAFALSYDAAIYDAASIKRMLEHFKTLLETVAADADQRISQLRLLREAETAGASPEDFPEAGLSQKDFETLLMELSKTGGAD